MTRRALVGLAIVLLGLGSGCALGDAALSQVRLEAERPGSPADGLAADGSATGEAPSARVSGGLEPFLASAVLVPTPGATYRVGDAIRSGDLIVALLDGRAAASMVEARFLIHNAGLNEAVVSPGNFRLRIDGERPRMRLREPPSPLPIGRLRPGDTLDGSVSWEVSDGRGARVVFANGAAAVEWALAS